MFPATRLAKPGQRGPWGPWTRRPEAPVPQGFVGSNPTSRTKNTRPSSEISLPVSRLGSEVKASFSYQLVGVLLVQVGFVLVCLFWFWIMVFRVVEKPWKPLESLARRACLGIGADSGLFC